VEPTLAIIDEKLKQGEKVINFANRHICKDGTFRWLEWTSHPIPKRGITFAVGHDITNRKQAEEKLRISELNYRTIFDSGYDAIVVHDMENGAILDVNKRMCEMFGYTHAEALNLTVEDISLGELSYTQKDAAEWLHKAKTQGPQMFEWIVKKKNGETFWVDVTLKRVTIAGHERILATDRDITDRKQAEEEKRKALEFAAEQRKHALIGQVAGKMAHDFNNVLMGIMGNAQLAILDCDDEKVKVKLEHINEFSERGRDITSTLLSFSKDQEPKQTSFKIEDKMELVLRMLEKDLTGIKVSRNYKPEIPLLLADPGMIQDVLVNLIQNSIHAMSKVENPMLNLKTYSQDGKIYFEIEDNGCGIPEEHQDSVYTPSFTLKGSHDKTGFYKSGIKGTGYGMSNVKKYIVEKHKGEIFLESEVEKGTRITVVLRIIKDHLSFDEKKEVLKSQIYDKRRILLVEDESAIADVQYQILTKEPFRHIVSIAANGQMAIDIFNRNKFDVVSLDYMLPGNVDGLDVYNHIRENDKEIPVMFISGNIEFLESVRQLTEKDPNLEHISKPVDNLGYVNKINELIGRSIK